MNYSVFDSFTYEVECYRFKNGEIDYETFIMNIRRYEDWVKNKYIDYTACDCNDKIPFEDFMAEWDLIDNEDYVMKKHRQEQQQQEVVVEQVKKRKIVKKIIN